MSAFTINTPNAVDTCGSVTISYSYTGSVTPGDAGLVLGISNANIDQSPLGLPEKTVIEPLTTYLPATSSGSYTWDVINVPAGYYIIQGQVMSSDMSQQVNANSGRFLVQNGTDVTCIYGQPPVEHKSHAGAIAGGVIGGLAALLLLILGAFFLNKKLKQRAALRRESQEMKEEPRESFAALGNNHRLSTIPPSTAVGSDVDAYSQKGGKSGSNTDGQDMEDPFGDHNAAAVAASGPSRSGSMRARNRKPVPSYDGDAEAEARAAVENASPNRTQHFLTPDAPVSH